MRKPRNTCPKFTALVREFAADYNMEIPEGFELFGTKTNTGRCHPNGTITVPKWLMKRPTGHLIQYIAHEIAHAYTWLETKSWKHNALFMEFMMILCPEEHWHYELLYRPTAAKAAGITANELTTWGYPA